MGMIWGGVRYVEEEKILRKVVCWMVRLFILFFFKNVADVKRFFLG